MPSPLPGVDYSVSLNAPLVAGTNFSPGQVAILNSTGTAYVLATTANRAAAPAGALPLLVLYPVGQANQLSFQALSLGIMPAHIFNLGAGSVSPVGIDGGGNSIRTTNGDPTVFAVCDASGTVTVAPWRTSGGGAIAPSGTGMVHVTNGAFDATADLGTANQVLTTNATATDRLWSTIGGDLLGPIATAVVMAIHGASVPAAGALTTGNVLQVSGASALTYGPVNLAGGVNYVTGTLPQANLPTLGGDVTGPYTANLVGNITAGATLDSASGFSFPTSGNLRVAEYSSATPILQGRTAGTTNAPIIQVYGTGAELIFGDNNAWNVLYQGFITDLEGGSSINFYSPTITFANFSSSFTNATWTMVGSGGTSQLQFGTGVIPTINQASTSNATASNFTIGTQASTATNGSPASLLINIPAPTGSGTRAYLQVQEGGTNYVWLGRWQAGGAIGALVMGSNISAPTGTNFCLLCDGNTVTELNTPSASGTVHIQCANADQLTVTTSQVTLTPSTVQWVSGATGPTINQASTSGATGANLTIAPQASTATNGTPGSLIANIAAPTGSGTPGWFTVQYGGTTVIQMGVLPAFGSTFGGIWLGNTTTPSATNYTLIGTANGDVQLNATTGGTLFFQNGNTTEATLTTSALTLTPSVFQWAATTTSPEIAQAQTSGSSPQNLSIFPQTSSAATVNAASLIVGVQSPAGGGTQGFLQVQQGGTGFVWLGEWTGGSPYGALYLGQHASTPSNVNYALISDGQGDTQLNTPGTGTLFLMVNNVQQMSVTTSAVVHTPALLQFAAATTSPTIDQIQLGSTGSNAGQTLLVQAQQGQQQTGSNANNNGGTLTLSSGTAGTGGTGAAGSSGNVGLAVGGTTQLQVGPNGLQLTATSISTSGGTLTLTQAQYQNAVIRLTGTLTSALTVVFPNTASGVWFVDISGLTFSSLTVGFKSGTSGTVGAISTGSAPNQIVMISTTGSNGIAINL